MLLQLKLVRSSSCIFMLASRPDYTTVVNEACSYTSRLQKSILATPLETSRTLLCVGNIRMHRYILDIHYFRFAMISCVKTFSFTVTKRKTFQSICCNRQSLGTCTHFNLQQFLIRVNCLLANISSYNGLEAQNSVRSGHNRHVCNFTSAQ